MSERLRMRLFRKIITFLLTACLLAETGFFPCLALARNPINPPNLAAGQRAANLTFGLDPTQANQVRLNSITPAALTPLIDIQHVGSKTQHIPNDLTVRNHLEIGSGQGLEAISDAEYLALAQKQVSTPDPRYLGLKPSLFPSQFSTRDSYKEQTRFRKKSGPQHELDSLSATPTEAEQIGVNVKAAFNHRWDGSQIPKSSVVSVPEMRGSRSYPRIPQKLKDTPQGSKTKIDSRSQNPINVLKVCPDFGIFKWAAVVLAMLAFPTLTYAAGGIPVLIAAIEIPDAILVLAASLTMGYGLRRLFQPYWDKEAYARTVAAAHQKIFLERGATSVELEPEPGNAGAWQIVVYWKDDESLKSAEDERPSFNYISGVQVVNRLISDRTQSEAVGPEAQTESPHMKFVLKARLVMGSLAAWIGIFGMGFWVMVWVRLPQNPALQALMTPEIAVVLLITSAALLCAGSKAIFQPLKELDKEDEVNGNKRNHEKRDAIAVGAIWSALVFGVLAAWLLELPNAVPIALFLVSRLMIYSGTALAGLWLWWHLAKRS